MNTSIRLFSLISLIFTTSFLLFSQSIQDIILKREIETLRQQGSQEKKLDKYMDSINKIYYNTLCVTAFMYFINVLMTIKMINTNYHNNSTLSCFASFTLLVLMKLYNSLSVGRQSVKDDKMMSAYMSEFVSFNVLDKDYVKEKRKRKT